MTITDTLLKLKRELIRSFAILDEWFDKDDNFLDFKPPDAKSVREIFEHIIQLSSAMMTIIDDGGDHARKQSIVNRQQGITLPYELHDVLMEDSHRDNIFDAVMQRHSKEAVCKSLPEIRSDLRDQLDRCLCHLDLLKHGEGVLFNTDFDFKGSKAINVYQCMRLLSFHVQRYTALLLAAEEEFNNAL